MRTIICTAFVILAGSLRAEITLNESNSWAFTPPREIPYADSLIDLRTMNEAIAGEHGYVRLSGDGNDFARGDGIPLRFWCTHNGIKPDWTITQSLEHARWQASLGVNLVIAGGGLNPKWPGAKLDDVDGKELTNTWKAVWAYRENGIYTMLRMYWCFPGYMAYVPPEWGIEGYGGKDPDMHAVLFIDPTLQKAYKAWVKKLLCATNSFTGIPLKDDPAVAMFEIMNEDSLLFFTFNNLHGGPRRRLEQMFYSWSTNRYGTGADALKAWDNANVEGDAPEEGRLGIMNIWFLTREGRGKMNEQRCRDQLRFLIKVQRDFYADIKSYLKDELGCRMLITPSNFRSADLVVLEDALRYTWMPMDAMCNNSYFGPNTKSSVEGWRLDAGAEYSERSGTRDPLGLPTNKKQVAGRPFLITESLWVRPHPCESEGPLLVAAYQSLNGIDAVSWAGPRDVTWEGDNLYMTWWTHEGSHPMSSFGCGQPGTMGNFPAAALLYRQGYVRPGATVVHEVRTLDEIVARAMPMIAEEYAFDPTKFSEDYKEENLVVEGVPAEAFLVGRVEVAYADQPGGSYAHSITQYIDSAGSVVRSTTGELMLDRGRGLFTVNTPKAQGITGFLSDAGGAFSLGDIGVVSKDHHATIIVVALDDRPIADSEKLLVQVGTLSRPTGWRTEPAGQSGAGATPRTKLLATGHMPWRVLSTDTRITIRNAGVGKAVKLDEAGRPAGPVALKRSGNAVGFAFPKDSMYVVLTK